MQASSVCVASKFTFRVKSLQKSVKDPSSISMAEVAAPKWAQKTISLPPQKRGCHLITSKVSWLCRFFELETLTISPSISLPLAPRNQLQLTLFIEIKPSNPCSNDLGDIKSVLKFWLHQFSVHLKKNYHVIFRRWIWWFMLLYFI